jgi:hypothetical protein
LACQDGYIELNRSATSRSGLYASDLPGVEIQLFEGLVKEEQNHYIDLWEMIYDRSWTNLISDVSAALQKKFHVDLKLISRETSKYLDTVNSGSGLAGVELQFTLSKYSRLHVLSVEVNADVAAASPGITIYFYDTDEDGDLLHSESAAIVAGKNTIFIDRTFEVDKLFVAYQKADFDLKGTENRYYKTGYTSFDAKGSCMWPCLDGSGSVSQIEGGGLNVKYVVECSIEKYVCENINFFAKALWYRIGLELTVERRFGNRLNEFTTMTIERATELQEFFNAQYQQALKNGVDAVNIHEDPFCFNCKGSVSSRSILS